MNATNNKSLIRLISIAFAAIYLVLFSFGCSSGKEIARLKNKIDNLKDENSQLSKNNEQINEENKQLKLQIATLQNLPEDVKGSNLYHLETIKIHNYSTLYDDDEDGKPDTLIVRVQPVDNYGDLIKATGSAEVELWDLNKPEGQALIGKWNVNTEELKKAWNGTLLKNFRLSFDISGKIEKFEEPLTLKLVFTDYLSGKIFHVQKVIKP